MEPVLVRDLKSEVVDKLKERAKLQGHSLNTELKQILAAAANGAYMERVQSAADVQSMFSGSNVGDNT